jgi:hypothetical protein
MTRPALSVVVTIVDGGETLARLLAGLQDQASPPSLEVLVPYDETVPGIAPLETRFPFARFLALGRVATERPCRGAAGQHELFDRRRAAGLAAATGDLVAILEDRGVPRPDWARAVVAEHARLPHAVIGGAIENGRHSRLHWAVYFCDFGRYHLPFQDGPREYVSDVNICYKRRALDQTRHLWSERYHETTVHWALARSGETLYLSSAFAVDQMRDGLTLGRVLAERLDWGRLFAYTRARELSRGKSLQLAALSPLLPALLLIRHVRQQRARPLTFGRLIGALPVMALLLGAWSVGELRGYVTRRP